MRGIIGSQTIELVQRKRDEKHLCGEDMTGLKHFYLSLFALATIASPTAALSQNTPVTLRDSFPIGEADGILCQVQDRSLENKAKQSIFDRSWAVVCRDSARPVGYVYSARKSSGDLLARISSQRTESVTCPATSSGSTDGFQQKVCRLTDQPIPYSIYQGEQNNSVYVAEGLAAYDSATLLALKSIVNDQIATGTIDVATTSIEDPFAFARVQAATLKPEQALAEGYRRNLSGNYAEAAAFFETLQQRTSGMDDDTVNPEEYLINRALQKSNLGEFAEADRLFKQSLEIKSGNPITERLRRNFEAMHLLNQGRFSEVVDRINEPIESDILEKTALTENLEITVPISSRINADDETAGLLGFTDDLKLSQQERAEIIDAQALQLLGTAQRIDGNSANARRSLIQAHNRAIAVRDGRVTSITRLRAQTLSELALISESEGNNEEAEQLLRGGLELLSIQYPETRAVNGAQARLASFLLRSGKQAEAQQLYRQVVDNSLGKRSAIAGIANQLAPYFELMADDPDSAEEFFKATQVLIRPGVAETQATLSRELSAGNDEASRLFRQSTNLARNIERLRIRFSALGKVNQNSAVSRSRSDLAVEIENLERSQQLTQARLAEYPQYRAVASRFISLTDLRDNMTADEAYVRMAIVGGRIFMFYADQNSAQVYKVELTQNELDQQVDALRASISVFENGQYVTYPFDITVGRNLYKTLFAPISTKLASSKHLIFEPDGALLRLPINLLVTDDVSVSNYLARNEEPDADPYDFTNVSWLGKKTNVSTAVSARAFTDARQAPPSAATKEYLGMGNNTPVSGATNASSVRSSRQGMDSSCQWALSEWDNPISDAELKQARSIVGQSSSTILTGDAFSDDQIKNKSDISDYRILHFATHGFVTAPNPSCPTKPSLLTSFGGENSDGLLAFDEIFDLRLDADIVILSACDTAGKASIVATREAGVSTGGGTSLDGLVRSFIGAGGRSILASHWPAPDDFEATERLIGGLFSDGQNLSVAEAMRTSQLKLMDDPNTSHPYYWAGFAIVGDGARPFLSTDRNASLKTSASSKKVSALK
ncbi:MAG: CHAT domain-containing protein [Parasphingorhabdus sp.]